MVCMHMALNSVGEPTRPQQAPNRRSSLTKMDPLANAIDPVQDSVENRITNHE
jgi:hypothetical protein